MWHAFVVFCTLGVNPSWDSCFTFEYPELLRTEEECQYIVSDFVMNSGEVDPNSYIFNLGCNNLLEIEENDTI